MRALFHILLAGAVVLEIFLTRTFKTIKTYWHLLSLGSPAALATKSLGILTILSLIVYYTLHFALVNGSYTMNAVIPAFFSLPSPISQLPTMAQVQELHNRIDRIQATCIDHNVAYPHYVDINGIRRVDFALYTSGGRALPGLTSPSRAARGVLEATMQSVAALWSSDDGEDSESAVNPWPRGANMALHYVTVPGYCWPFEGSTGHLGIRLTRRILLTDVTIDHVADGLVLDRRSAPRQMSLWGLVDAPDDMDKVQVWEETGGIFGARKHYAADPGDIPEEIRVVFRDTGKWVQLASLRYDIASPSAIQTFPVDNDVRDLGVAFQTVVLVVNDNWGHPDFTCIYKVRVHGEPADAYTDLS